jgi:hypothetical protein
VTEASVKTYVQFDADGRIHSIVTVEGPNGVRAMVDVEPGLSVAEIDATELEPPTTDSDIDRIRAVTQDYRVSVPAAVKATLTKTK